MTELVSTTTGLFPLPDWAKGELAELKGHQKHDLVDGDEDAAVTEAYDAAREEIIDLQRDAGLDISVEGQLRWDDMLAHPLAVHDSVDTRGIVRYYDNNNFYREPVVQDELTADGDVAADLEAATDHAEGVGAVLPGPYSLFDLATDEYYGTDAAFLDAIAAFLAEEAGAVPDVELLTLLEPSLVTNPPEDGLDERASEAIDRVASALDAETIVYPYWGALDEKVYAHLLDAEIDAVGFDLVSAHDANVYNVQEYGTTDDVVLGLVDGQNTRVESVERIHERVEWFREQTPIEDYDRLYLTPNTGLFYLPTGKLEAKLDALGEATATAEVTA
jgi:5-methyltetrahydropteroyltriglutamate--homocysteine methyltransferase